MSDSPITPATRFESYMFDISSNLEQIAQKMTPEGAGGDDSGATELYKLKPATRFESYMSDISSNLEQIAQNVTPGGGGGGGGGGGLPTTGGTMSGAINMDGNAITNLPQASASGDAVSYGQVAQMVANDGGTEITTWSQNHYYIPNSSGTVDLDHPAGTSVDVRYLVTTCAPGDTFRVTATGGSSYRAYSFLDTSSNVLDVALSNEALTDAILTAPMGSAKLLVNDKTLAGSVYKIGNSDSDLFSLSRGRAVGISANTDLDTLTTPGNYYVATSGVAASLVHSPVSNVGFALKVMHTSDSNRYAQIAITNATLPEVYLRSRIATWGDWRSLSAKDDSIEMTNIHLTSSNYLTYFTNGSFNDAPVNSVVGIGDNVPLTDGPDGDNWIGYGSHTSTGYISGTLLTFRPNKTNATVYRGIAQILIGYRTTDYSPTLSYRIAVVGSNGLDWSAWSKFEQNGYLRSGNRAISAGRMDETVHDLDYMPLNEIWQIDLNCNGSTAESTLGHHPFPGVSCVVVNMGFSYSTRHGQVQTVYAIDGRVAWRYGYQNNVNDYRWRPWSYYATYIPTAPTTDGTYTLQCTVSNGAATYAWVSAA